MVPGRKREKSGELAGVLLIRRNRQPARSERVAADTGFGSVDLRNGARSGQTRLKPVNYLGWVEGFEPSATGTTIRRSTKLSYTHHVKGTPV